MNSWVFLAFSSSSQAEVIAESCSLRSYLAGLPHWACPIQTGFLEVLLFYWKPLSMYTQTFQVKAAAFNPADTKATWKASTIRKAIQKLRISLRSGKPHPPDFPGNLRQASLLMPSLLHLMVRMKTLTTPQWWGLGKGHLPGGGGVHKQDSLSQAFLPIPVMVSVPSAHTTNPLILAQIA